MKKFNYKKSSVQIDESKETLKIDGKEIPIQKTENGFGIYYLTGFKDIEKLTKAHLDTQ